jgi:hypothetical protein
MFRDDFYEWWWWYPMHVYVFIADDELREYTKRAVSINYLLSVILFL